MALRVAGVALAVFHVASALGTWQTAPWSQCSVKCGNGTATRAVSCAGASCEEGTKPSTSKECRGTACPWDVHRVSGWQQCENGCGSGSQLSMPACDCPMPCVLPGNDECKDTPLPPASQLLQRPCFGSALSSVEYCSQCSFDGKNCSACSKGFKLDHGRCTVTERSVRQAIDLSATSKILSPMNRAVSLAKALEKVVLSLNASASVTSMLNQEISGDFLSVRRLGGSVCKTARVVSQGGQPPLGFAEFYLDDKKIDFPEEEPTEKGNNTGRGIAVVEISPDTLEVVNKVDLDIFATATSVRSVTTYLNGLQDGAIVLIAVKDSGIEMLDDAALKAFHRVGGALQGLGSSAGFRQPYVFIGQVGEPAIQELWGKNETKVQVTGKLPCSEPSEVNLVLVAQPNIANSDLLQDAADNSTLDKNFLALANRFKSLKPDQITDQLSSELKSMGIDVPPSFNLKLKDLQEFCPDPMTWHNDACVMPGGSSFPWWVLAVVAAALLACLLGGLLWKKCKHRQGVYSTACGSLPLMNSDPTQARVPTIQAPMLRAAGPYAHPEKVSEKARAAAEQAKKLRQPPDAVARAAADAARSAGSTYGHAAEEAGKAAADAAITAGHQPIKVQKAASDAVKAAGGNASQATKAAGAAAAQQATKAGKTPTQIATAAADAVKAAGGSASDASKAACDAAAKASHALHKNPEAVAQETMKAAKAAGASVADASKTAGEAAKHAAVKAGHAPADAAKLAADVASKSGSSLLHASKAASDAAGQSAMDAGKSATEVAKHAAEAAKAAGTHGLAASEAAADAATKAAVSAAKTPADAALKAQEAAKAAGASTEHALQAAGNAAGAFATKAGQAPAAVGKAASDAVKSAGGTITDAAKAAGAHAAKAAKDAGHVPEDIAKQAAEAAKSAGGSASDVSAAAATAAKEVAKDVSGNELEAAYMTANAAKAAGASLEDFTKNAGAAAAEIAHKAGKTPEEVAKIASEATKLAGGTEKHASEAASEAATTAAMDVAKSKDEAEKIAKDAAAKAGAMPDHAQKALSKLTSWFHK